MLVVMLAACGGAVPRPVASPAPAPVSSHRPLAWQSVGDVRWGLAFAPGHFEVDLLRGSRLLSIEDGRRGAVTEVQPAALASEPGAFDPAPELEQLDRDFAARSAQEGGSAWAEMFAADGAEWSDGKRVDQVDIGQVMGRVLLGATLEWTPVASGKRDDLGFTLGTYVLASKHSAQREAGSYCSIWRKQADGSWKILLDIGSGTEN